MKETKEEKKEKVKAIKKKGTFAMVKMFNDLCPKCKLLSYRMKSRGLQDRVFSKYCQTCKDMLEERWG